MQKHFLFSLCCFFSLNATAQWDTAVEHATTGKHQISFDFAGLKSKNTYNTLLNDQGFVLGHYIIKQLDFKLGYQYNLKPTLGIKTGIGLNWRIHNSIYQSNKELGQSLYHLEQNCIYSPTIQIPLLLAGRSKKPILGKRIFFNWEAGVEMSIASNMRFTRDIIASNNGEPIHFLELSQNNINQNIALNLNAALGFNYVLNNGDQLALKWRSTYRLTNPSPYQTNVTFLPDQNNASTSLDMPRWSTGLEIGYVKTLGKRKKASYKKYKMNKYANKFP